MNLSHSPVPFRWDLQRLTHRCRSAAGPEVVPIFVRLGNVFLLRALVPRAEENNQLIPVKGGIDTIAWTKINSQFNDALAYRSMIAEISHFGARDAHLDLGGRLAITQRIHMFDIGFNPCSSFVDDGFPLHIRSVHYS